MLTITEKAAAKARSLLDDKGLSPGALRVFVVGGGCAGYQYGMALASAQDERDVVLEEHGVKLVLDPESASMLEGAEIDFVDDVMNSGFKISNPNAVSNCACGSSFQTADRSGRPRSCC